jgi:hypothetical protein
MNRVKQIINKTLSIIGALLLAGCETSKPDWGKYRGESHKHGYSSLYKEGDVLYQAWDYQYPNISPAFVIKEEAKEYATMNNYGFNGRRPTGHKYVVREIGHRYEILHQNDAVNNVIFTSANLKEAEGYLNTYKTNHTDLVIMDLLTQEIVGVNTP